MISINGPETIFDTPDLIAFYKAQAENFPIEQQYQHELYESKLAQYRLKYRLAVPYGRTKKFYETLLKETRNWIAFRKQQLRENKQNYFAQVDYEDFLEKEEKIRSILKALRTGGDGTQKIQDAKKVPISHYIEFNGGFAKCLWHDEKTASMKYYPQTNTVHCFSCQRNGDTIDVIQQLHRLSFIDAVKLLCNSK